MKFGRSRRETVELFILLQTKVKRVFSEYFSWKPRMKSYITWPICLFWGNLRFNYLELYLFMTCLHDLLKAQALQCNNCEKLLRKWWGKEWDARIRSHIIDGACRIRKPYSWQENADKSNVWWSQERLTCSSLSQWGWSFQEDWKCSNLNLLLWPVTRSNMLIQPHAVTLFLIHFLPVP